ncbi:MAG: (2Fe-2S)-binding protein [Dehalococcoidia bacterium]
MTGTREIALTVNGVKFEGSIEVRTTLADFLREELDLTGTHLGCEHGVCGACTILVDGQAVRSCLMLAVQADGASLTTIEALASLSKEGSGDQTLHPLQRAFNQNHALQCGFCTPGLLMTAYALLQENPHPTEHQVREAISGNLCRCTGYIGIINAILQVSRSGGRS